MENTARLFNCRCCQIQVIICRKCDRANVYSPSCAMSARAKSLREASKRYQNTPRGRSNHAARQRRYQEKKKKMTHHSSHEQSPTDLILNKPSDEGNSETKAVTNDIHCHFCGSRCSKFLRRNFLRHSFEHKLQNFSSWPSGP